MFQNHVNRLPAPGIPGGFASQNPYSTIDAGPGKLVAGSSGTRVAAFAWITDGVVSSFTATGAVPRGFVANEQQALITTWLDNATLIIPEGLPVTVFDRGDFWAYSNYSDASTDDKVFANVFTGEIYPAPTGSFPVSPAGTSGTVTASFATNVMTVTATSIYIAPGMKVTGAGVPADTYIMAQLTGSAGSTGTYSLTTYPGTVASGTITLASPTGTGGATASSCSADSGSTTLTINTLTNGTIAAGQLVSGTSIPSGTYISALGTSTGGTGTVTLSAATTDTISAAQVLFSAWVETPWYVKSAGNVGDLIKIGIRN